MTNKCLLEEVTEDQHKCEGYCLLKEIILHDAKYNERLVLQCASINKFKYVISKKEGKDIGWDAAGMRWFDEGWAKKFAEVYEDGQTLKECWKKLGIE